MVFRYSGLEKPYFTTLSPAEILDRQLKLGHDLHRSQAAAAASTNQPPHWPIAEGTRTQYYTLYSAAVDTLQIVTSFVQL